MFREICNMGHVKDEYHFLILCHAHCNNLFPKSFMSIPHYFTDVKLRQIFDSYCRYVCVLRNELPFGHTVFRTIYCSMSCCPSEVLNKEYKVLISTLFMVWRLCVIFESNVRMVWCLCGMCLILVSTCSGIFYLSVLCQHVFLCVMLVFKISNVEGVYVNMHK